MILPKFDREVHDKLVKFKDFLNQRGAELIDPTNEFELVRFRTERGTSVIYTKKTGKITFYGEAETAWLAFRNATNWRARPATKRSKCPVIATLRRRDGDLCFFCQKYVSDEDATQEHLVALTHGGSQHISNKYLAHKLCNFEVGYLSATEKIKIHVNKILEIKLTEFRRSLANVNHNQI